MENDFAYFGSLQQLSQYAFQSVPVLTIKLALRKGDLAGDRKSVV